ncbi:MAG: class I SAM-dependent methyltransferase [Legionellales bacterium]|nr:class I SAM-dependent methyltransferase [Legionellales bacterium]
MSKINKIAYKGGGQLRAEDISRKYKLDLISNTELANDMLVVDDDKIFLKLTDYSKDFFVDFLENSLEYRISNLTRESLIKACGIKKNRITSVLDLTGGWGVDSYILARAGCRVLVLERDPVVYLLLKDGIERLQRKIDCDITIKQINSVDYLAENDVSEQIIYIDPIRPQLNKTAKNNKSMEILRRIIQPDQKYEDLLNLALTKFSERLVIKTGRHENINFIDYTPNFTILGKNTKFMVFI